MENTFWQAIIDADYAVPEGQSASALLPELLAMLGSTDPVLRDEYCYPILAVWIERGLYTPAELRAMGRQMEDNLKVGITEPGSDAVFLRTFSALILECVIEYDQLQPFLEEQEVRAWLEASLQYLEQEQDLRGYVQVKGWAHSAAHTADLLMILAQNRYLGVADLERILNAIADKVRKRVAHVYLYGEDDRLAYAVRKALKRDLLEMPFLTAWLERLTASEGLSNWFQASFKETDVSASNNIREFVRSLYFQLKFAPEPPTITPELFPVLEETLRTLGSVFYSMA
ncbi:DUF2785 domain-containing protein [Ktedonobacter robiniae]|uniref:Membrane protein n=1 Tax=Ktedonobacter robiniae TaxID=2778365 RepID=A0ABQ3UXA2_9CHLR|nr:DUF2785 domain-containing protein [Ktedonobacter robiniae]GHO57388.1 membrane protein [Ktedonobacter robiniae]